MDKPIQYNHTILAKCIYIKFDTHNPAMYDTSNRTMFSHFSKNLLTYGLVYTASHEILPLAFYNQIRYFTLEKENTCNVLGPGTVACF